MSLGFWQVERLAWKEDLLARIEQRLSAESLVLASADDIASLRREAHDYHPAVIDATRSGASVLWFTQIENAPAGIAPADRVGYHVLTPVVLADGAHILLDEGFVPARLKDQICDRQGKVQRLPVVIRWPDARSIFAAENDLENGLVYVRDAPQIGRHFGISLPPVIVESANMPAGAEAPWPRGGQTRISLSNRHLEYAFTWFALAAVLVFISGLWHMRGSASAKIRVSGGVYQHERPRNGTVIRTDLACRAGRMTGDFMCPITGRNCRDKRWRVSRGQFQHVAKPF